MSHADLTLTDLPYTQAVVDGIAKALERAELTADRLSLPPANASVKDLEAYLAGRLAARWLTAPAGDPGPALDVAWAATLSEAAWSGPADAADTPPGPWLRGAIAAFFALMARSDAFIPPSGGVGIRGLHGFQYAQAGAVLSRCFGRDTLVRLQVGAVTPAEALGEAVWASLESWLGAPGEPGADALGPGRGLVDPAAFARAVYAACDAAGREFPSAKAEEAGMLAQVLEWSMLEAGEGDAVTRTLPFSAVKLDYDNYSLEAEATATTPVRRAALPPEFCRRRVREGHHGYHVAVLATTRRNAYGLVRHIATAD